ncbi:MAG: hypothetical protein GSR77_03775 [Desulfurococcales archaeon]|nr:hypothetical protein [Desulfurococcales archaeon]
MTRFFLLFGPTLDVLTTYVGVFMLGLHELGRVPRALFSVLGSSGLAVMFLYEVLLGFVLYRLSRHWLGDAAIGIAVSGPWYAGWHNIGVLVRVITG